MQLEQIICQARKVCRLVNDLCRITLSAEEIAGIFEQLTEILPPLNKVVGAVTGTQGDARRQITLALLNSESRAVAFFVANASLFPA